MSAGLVKTQNCSWKVLYDLSELMLDASSRLYQSTKKKKKKNQKKNQKQSFFDQTLTSLFDIYRT